MPVRSQRTPWMLAPVCWFACWSAVAATLPACSREVLLGHISEPPELGPPPDPGADFGSSAERIHFRSTQPLATAADPQAIQGADLDRDGRIDLIVAHGAAKLVRSFLGGGDGTFPRFFDTPCGDPVSDLAVADFNQDQRLDLAVMLATQGRLQVFAGSGDGTFTAARAYATGSGPLLATDLNGDGHLDIAVATAGEVVILLSGSLGIGFEPLTPSRIPLPSAASALAAADLNRDGFPDLTIAMGALPALRVLINDGSGSFRVSSPMLVEPAQTVALVALSAGGAPSGVVTGATTLSLLSNRGDGTLFQDLKIGIRYPVGPDPRRLASADLDRDGNLDLLTASASEATLSVLFGTGAGDIQRIGSTLRIAAPAAALAIGDWNHDATPDIAVATTTPPELQILVGLLPP